MVFPAVTRDVTRRESRSTVRRNQQLQVKGELCFSKFTGPEAAAPRGVGQHAPVRTYTRVRIGRVLLMLAAAVAVSSCFVPAAGAEPHSVVPPWWSWWNPPGLCAHAVSDPGANPVLAQSVQRDDHERHATLHVSVYSTVAVDKPQFLSCAFVDSDGNGVLSQNERWSGHVVNATPVGANALQYDRQLVADPKTSVCVVTALFGQTWTATPLSSRIGCVVNPGPMVPESPVPVLLGVVGVGVLGGFGLLRRRKMRHAVS
jgi:hypothetical protein